MNGIFSYLKSYVILFLVLTILLEMVPKAGMQKYIRFFSSLILVLILASPIFRILGMDENFRQMYNSAEYRQMKREIEEKEQFIKEQEQAFWNEADDYEDSIEMDGVVE